MKRYNRLLVIADGTIYRNDNNYYVSGSSQLDLYDIFEGIEEIYIWTRIYDISKEDAQKYNRYDIENFQKKIIFCGITNQPKGYLGYVYTLTERYKKLNVLLKKPFLVMFAPVSLSQWVLWYCFRRRDLLFITRIIGDPEGVKDFNKPFSKMFILLMKYTLKNVNKKACLQTWVSNELENKYKNNTTPSLVFHDCLISERDISSCIKLRKEPSLKLIFVGRLSPEKGISDLLNAIKKIDSPDISLRIVGEGVGREQLNSEIKQLKLESKVVLFGSIKWGTELFSAMKEADCLILPSYNEGLSMVLLEAMSNGLPVIASRVGGIPDIVTEGENGLLFPPGDIKALEDKIKIFYENESLRRMMAQNALQTAHENTREKQLEKFEDSYKEYVYKFL